MDIELYFFTKGFLKNMLFTIQRFKQFFGEYFHFQGLRIFMPSCIHSKYNSIFLNEVPQLPSVPAYSLVFMHSISPRATLLRLSYWCDLWIIFRIIPSYFGCCHHASFTVFGRMSAQSLDLRNHPATSISSHIIIKYQWDHSIDIHIYAYYMPILQQCLQHAISFAILFFFK